MHQLSDEGLAIRVGIHTGDVYLTEIGDLAGIAVNVAKRICDIASASTVLVSDAARPSLDALPYQIDSRGEHAIRGVTYPLELFSLRATKR
jgi:class 3 adenylate cyclase